jgi:ATP-dependent Clp protease ATP-binding subunit ClpC
LIGLLTEGRGTATAVLKYAGIDVDQLLRYAETVWIRATADASKRCGILSRWFGTVRILHTPRAKNIIANAIEEAHGLNHNYVGTEHILLSLLRDKECVAGAILLSHGIQLDDIREKLLELLSRGAHDHGS